MFIFIGFFLARVWPSVHDLVSVRSDSGHQAPDQAISLDIVYILLETSCSFTDARFNIVTSV